MPDRSAESGAVSTTLRALPGVASVDGQYANGMTTGRSYNVTISLESDLDEAALTTIARTYDEQIAAAELAGHTLALTVRSPRGDRLNLFGRDGRMEATPPTVSAGAGYRRGTGPADLEWDRGRTSGDPVGRHRDDGGDAPRAGGGSQSDALDHSRTEDAR